MTKAIKAPRRYTRGGVKMPGMSPALKAARTAAVSRAKKAVRKAALAAEFEKAKTRAGATEHGRKFLAALCRHDPSGSFGPE